MRQEWLFDPGPPGASERMRERRACLVEVVRSDAVYLLGQVASKLGCAYSTFVRWRRLDPELDAILRVVLHRKHMRRKGRR